jgi:hypothetical protein
MGFTQLHMYLMYLKYLLQLDGASREVDEGGSFLDSVGEEVLCLGSKEGEGVITEEEAQGSVVEEEDRLRLRYLHETESPTALGY